MNSIFSRLVLLLAGLLLIISCDKEANDIGANVLGDDNFGFEKYEVQNLIAYNKSTDEIQTSNIELAQLGIYESPVFGKVIASVGAQLLLDVPKDTLNYTIAPTIIDVVLDIPYTSSPKVADATSPKEYNIENIYGNESNKIKLSVYRSGNFIYGLDSKRNNEPIRFNSDIDFDTFKIGSRLNNSTNIKENDAFEFDNSERSEQVATITTNGPSTKTVYSAPSLRLKLDKSFGDDVFLAKSKLANNSDFREYYKGLFFKVEQSSLSASGRLALLDFRKGTVKVTYKKSGETKINTLNLNLSGSVVNSLKNFYSPLYSNALTNINSVTGDENLFLKGGKGSVAIIDVFGKDLNAADGITPASTVNSAGVVSLGNGIADELDIIRKEKWLVNDAKLVFNVDQTKMTSTDQPLRISLYNVNTGGPIIDYTSDTTLNKNIFSSVQIGNITQYKVRITNFIRELITNGGEDIKLGVYVSQNILNTNFSANKNLPEYTDILWKGKSEPYQRSFFFPSSSIINPLGTVLYGNTNAVPTDKKLKLEIIYSKVK